MQMERCHGVIRGVSADHDDVAMREVQKQDNAVNHTVAERDQRVNRAGLQAVQKLGKQQCHWGFPLFPVCSESKCLRTPDGCCRHLAGGIHPMSARVRRGKLPRRTAWTFRFVMSDPYFQPIFSAQSSERSDLGETLSLYR